MAAMTGPRVAVVGLGAIGGSVALALRDRGITSHGFTSAQHDSAEAARSGILVRSTIAEAVAPAEIVLLAVPLDSLAAVAARVCEANRTATVLHAGSLQRPATLSLEGDVAARVVGTHPLAGTHATGFLAARADMFRGAVVSVERRGTARQHDDAQLLWGLAGARRIEVRDAVEHDDMMAWVSHAPQFVATALASILATDLASGIPVGPGARDTTRLAASAFSVWKPILERAPVETLHALRAMERSLAEVRERFETRDMTGLQEIWDRAREWRIKQDVSS
jgi:prephenate dehydrogenase